VTSETPCAGACRSSARAGDAEGGGTHRSPHIPSFKAFAVFFGYWRVFGLLDGVALKDVVLGPPCADHDVGVIHAPACHVKQRAPASWLARSAASTGDRRDRRADQHLGPGVGNDTDRAVRDRWDARREDLGPGRFDPPASRPSPMTRGLVRNLPVQGLRHGSRHAQDRPTRQVLSSPSAGTLPIMASSPPEVTTTQWRSAWSATHRPARACATRPRGTSPSAFSPLFRAAPGHRPRVHRRRARECSAGCAHPNCTKNQEEESCDPPEVEFHDN
jgi:hypothetical protein